MARRYAIDGQDTNTANTSILGLTSAATIRPRIYDLIFGSDATPADMAAKYVLQRHTAAGTSTAVTPTALDPADPAALASAGMAHTIEPTFTAGAILLHFALNQRATFRWVAVPGAELVLPATAANGATLRVITTNGTPVNTNCTIEYEE